MKRAKIAKKAVKRELRVAAKRSLLEVSNKLT